MVLFYTSTACSKGAVQIYAGKDKVENEDLIKYALTNDVWVHVDKLSSPHIYIRLPNWISSWQEIPKEILDDAAQLVKSGSIQGNKKDNISVIYTPAANLLKTGDMDVGTVSFKNDRLVRRVHVPERVNAIVNRLNKTKQERFVDHEAEKVEREKEEAKVRRLEANDRRNKELELARQRKAEAESRDYSKLYDASSKKDFTKMSYEEEEEEWLAKQKEGDFDPDEDFM